MKRIMLLSIALAALFVSSPSEAVVISFQPSSTTVNLGDFFDIDVLVSDLGEDIVAAYDFDVEYDETILDVTNVMFGTSLGAPFDSFADSILSPGIVNLAEVSLLFDDELALLQPGPSFVLATISFHAIGPGTSQLTPSPSAHFEVLDIKGGDNIVLTATGQPGVVHVRGQQQAPEPGTLALILGMLGLLAARRRN